MRTLGILGGMGTLAGVDMVNLLVREAAERGVVGDSDYPRFVYYNLPTMALDCHGVTSDELLLTELKAGLHALQEIGANLLIVACNSAYRHFDEMKTWTGGSIISLIEAGCAAVTDSPVGVLQSDSCRRDGLYQRALAEHGVQIVPSSQQHYIDKAIEFALQGKCGAPGTVWVKDAINELQEAGAKSVLLGCTELPLLARGLNMPRIRLIDPAYEAVKQALNIMHNG